MCNASVEQAFIERHPLEGDSQRAGHQADRRPLDEDGCFLGWCGPVAAALQGDGFGRVA